MLAPTLTPSYSPTLVVMPLIVAHLPHHQDPCCTSFLPVLSVTHTSLPLSSRMRGPIPDPVPH